jgi:calpain-15
MVASAGSDVKS